MVKSISEVMLSTLPNFWKISVAFLDGKYRKVCLQNSTEFTRLMRRTECWRHLQTESHTMSNNGSRHREAIHFASF